MRYILVNKQLYVNFISSITNRSHARKGSTWSDGCVRFGSDKTNLYAYTRTMAHEEALVLTKEWDPRTFFPILFILSC